MRGVKYRIWDKENEVMMTDWQNFKFIKTIDEDSFLRLGVSNGIWTLSVENFENYVVMQCIGTKDKNGTEIYDGDTLEVEPLEKQHYPQNSLFYITSHLTLWGYEFLWEHIRGYFCSTHITEFDVEHKQLTNVEVIGNIYENPELLHEY